MVLEWVIRELLQSPFFRRRPPKTAGREEFGREFTEKFLQLCKGGSKRDIVATATAFTAESIRHSLNKFVIGSRHRYKEYVVSGGGAKNGTLLAMLANRLKPIGLGIRLSDEFGIPSAAKEAVAFALMAYQTWNRQPSNVPSATGARRPAILGKISYV
jgi:anhydro-N-acetylmuramic acid kinase